MLLKKKYIVIILFLAFATYTKKAYADSNCCVGHGTAYACNSITDQLYCSDGAISTDCTCHLSATPTPTPLPIPTATPTPPTPSPTCPPFSSYNTTTTACTCDSGYIVSNNTCISSTDYCWSKYGGNSAYDTNTNSCGCTQGYVWNSDGSSCISFDAYCQNSLGSKSYYNSDSNSCSCYTGYSIQDNKCQLVPTQALPNVQNTSQIIVTDTPQPEPSDQTIKVFTPTPTKIPVNKNPSIIVLKGNDKKLILLAKNNSQANLTRFFKNIWTFITHLI